MTPKSLIRSVLTLALFGACIANAHGQMRIGYCDEEPQTSTLRYPDTSATISCAIALTPTMQSAYTYTDISHLRVALTAPEQFTSLQIWVRSSLSDNTPLASADIDLSTLTAGWNSLALDQPVNVEAAQTLYCGYSYTQTEPTYLATSGKKGKAGSFWIAVDGAWSDYCKKADPICIQAELTSHYDQGMFLADYGLDRALVPDTMQQPALQLEYSFVNAGKNDISQYTLSYRVNNGAEQSLLVDCASQPVPFGQRGAARHTIALPEGLEGADNTIEIALSSPNGQENEYLTGCNATLYFAIEEPGIPDQSTPLLIEEFASLDNGYVPAGQQHLREAIGQCQRPVILISRHEGYGPSDALHLSGSDYAADFFGQDKLTFVPAAWIERQQTPFSSTLPADTIAELIEQTTTERYGTIVLGNIDYNGAERQLTATIDLDLRNISLYDNPTLVVCLVQAELATPEQKNYYPEAYDGTQQTQVVRSYAKLTPSGSLLKNANIDDLQHGRVPTSQYAKQHLTATLSLPDGLTTDAGEWHLIAYISDHGQTYRILAVCEHPVDIN